MEALRDCYSQLKVISGFEAESFEVVHAVEDYRQYWKPEKVRVILLAESHVFTTVQDFASRLKSNYGLPDFPNAFVRFVYCPGYGENDALTTPAEGNRGTPQFWKIFSRCATPLSAPLDFSALQRGSSRIYSGRMRRKI